MVESHDYSRCCCRTVPRLLQLVKVCIVRNSRSLPAQPMTQTSRLLPYPGPAAHLAHPPCMGRSPAPAWASGPITPLLTFPGAPSLSAQHHCPRPFAAARPISEAMLWSAEQPARPGSGRVYAAIVLVRQGQADRGPPPPPIPTV